MKPFFVEKIFRQRKDSWFYKRNTITSHNNVRLDFQSNVNEVGETKRKKKKEVGETRDLRFLSRDTA